MILSTIVISVEVSAQYVYEAVGSNVYEFLERMTVKGYINFNTAVKPITRGEIAGYILEADSVSMRLSSVEKQELNFYKEEYADEIDIITGNGNLSLPKTKFFSSGETGRFRVFRYRDTSFTFYADPILGYEVNFMDGKNYSHRFNGAGLSGYYNNWGFGLRFRDNAETGDDIDASKNLTPDPGINITKTGKQSIQYDEVDAQVNYGWNTGVISAGKYSLNWGSGRGGQLIFSDKAPTFPLIRLDFNPVSWLRFTYVHGWLHSGILDSSSFRYGLVNRRNTYQQIEKFIAAHMLTFKIPGNVDISIGESIVYSDHLEPIYLIPVMFFRAADHYLQRQNSTNDSNTGDNAQMFGDIYYVNTDIRTKFYSTLFIDELSLENVFKGGNLSAVAYTVGAETVAPVISNSVFTFEYSRLNPFVYMNSDLTQTFSSYGYQLGHWIGSNADQLFLSYKQWLLRGLTVELSGWYVRKGKKEDPEDQYRLPYPEFLYGNRLTWTKIGLNVDYEVFHNVFAKAAFTYSDISDEAVDRLPEFMMGRKSTITFGVSYGL